MRTDRMRKGSTLRRLTLVVLASLFASTCVVLGSVTSAVAAEPTFASSVNPSREGQLTSLTFTIPKEPSLPAPTGSVSFSNESTLGDLGTRSLDAAGVASMSASFSLSANEVNATYSGDTNYPSSRIQLIQNVLMTARLSLSSSSNPSTAGQPVTFTAQVSGSVTGSVTFNEDGRLLGTVPLGNSGTATFTQMIPSAGTHQITATYSGDSTNTDATDQLTQQVQAAGLARLASTVNPSRDGQLTTLTFTVPRDPGLPAPTGSVLFYNESTFGDLGTRSLDAVGVASVSASFSLSSNEVNATYSGDTNYPSSRIQLIQNVLMTARLSLSSSSNPSTAGQPVTFTAQVSGSVTGSVTFNEDGRLLGTVPLGNSGTATFTQMIPSAGTHQITATYSGDNANTDATDQLTQQIEIGVSRIAGSSRTETTNAVSRRSFPDRGSARVAVLVRADGFADALAGGPLAAAKNGPLLVTFPDALAPETATELLRVLPAGATVYVMGGKTALSPKVESAVVRLGYRTVRLQGPNRFATAVAAARATGTPRRIFVATGLDFPDALAGGAAAVKEQGVIVLTNGRLAAPETSAYLAENAQVARTSLGGPACEADPGARCVQGIDRYETSARVADAVFGVSPTSIGIATGLNFPDALAAGPFLGRNSAPLLLVSKNAPLPSPVALYLARLKAQTAVVFGGPNAVDAAVLVSVQTAMTPVG